MSKIIGFDIGGSSVKAVLVEDKEIKKSLIENLPGSLNSLLDLIKRMEEDLGADGVACAGFALAGVLDGSKENMLASPNIKYLDGQPLKKIFGEKLILKVKIENDVRCFLLAEKEIGRAKEMNNIFFLTLGTGIGGALMHQGKIIHGFHGSAGEAGHMVLDSAAGLEWEKMAGSQFVVRCLGIGSEEAFKLAGEGDEKSQEIFSRLGQNLGMGIANIVNILDPEAVIIAGGLAGAREYFEKDMKENAEKHVLSPEAKKTPILFSSLGRFGGALGAAMLMQNAQTH